MSRSPLADAFAHHTWANLRAIDLCADLTPEQLETTVPGTFGTIIDTLRHTISADSWYLFRVAGDAHPPIREGDENEMDLAALREAAERIGQALEAFVAGDVDAERVVQVRRDDGSGVDATVGLRLVQILHHGTDHRSQVFTALTQLGKEPPESDLWAFGLETGRVREISPAS